MYAYTPIPPKWGKKRWFHRFTCPNVFSQLNKYEIKQWHLKSAKSITKHEDLIYFISLLSLSLTFGSIYFVDMILAPNHDYLNGIEYTKLNWCDWCLFCGIRFVVLPSERQSPRLLWTLSFISFSVLFSVECGKLFFFSLAKPWENWLVATLTDATYKTAT